MTMIMTMTMMINVDADPSTVPCIEVIPIDRAYFETRAQARARVSSLTRVGWALSHTTTHLGQWRFHFGVEPHN